MNDNHSDDDNLESVVIFAGDISDMMEHAASLSYLCAFEHRVEVRSGEPDNCRPAMRTSVGILCEPELVYNALALLLCADGACLDCTTARDNPGNPLTVIDRSG